MTEFITERHAFSGNGDKEDGYKRLSTQTKAIEVAVLPESHQIETRLYGRAAFDPKDTFTDLLHISKRKLPEENLSFYVKPPESLFDGDWVDPNLAYSRDRAALTGVVIFRGIKEEVPSGIKVDLKVGAETIEDPDQLRRSLIANRVIPFPLM